MTLFFERTLGFRYTHPLSRQKANPFPFLYGHSYGIVPSQILYLAHEKLQSTLIGNNACVSKYG